MESSTKSSVKELIGNWNKRGSMTLESSQLSPILKSNSGAPSANGRPGRKGKQNQINGTYSDNEDMLPSQTLRKKHFKEAMSPDNIVFQSPSRKSTISGPSTPDPYAKIESSDEDSEGESEEGSSSVGSNIALPLSGSADSSVPRDDAGDLSDIASSTKLVLTVEIMKTEKEKEKDKDKDAKAVKTLECSFDSNFTIGTCIKRICKKGKLKRSKRLVLILQKSGLLLNPTQKMSYYNLKNGDVVLLMKKKDENQKQKSIDLRRVKSDGEKNFETKARRETFSQGNTSPSHEGRSFSVSASSLPIGQTATPKANPPSPKLTRENSFTKLSSRFRNSSVSGPSSPEMKRNLSYSDFVIHDVKLEGYVMKKNKNRRWKKRYLVVDFKNISIFKNQQDKEQTFSTAGHAPKPKVIELFCASVKKLGPTSEHFKFDIITTDKNHEFYCENEKDYEHYTNVLQEVCQQLIDESIQGVKKEKSKEGQLIKKSPFRKNSGAEHGFGHSQKEKLIQLLKLPQNDTCADCDTKKPEWASTNLGIFICIGCSGAHRSLGTHISKVKSVYLDDWDVQQVTNMAVNGNLKSNQFYEAALTVPKLTEKSSVSERIDFINKKYVQRLFLTKEVSNPEVPILDLFLQFENEDWLIGYVPDIDVKQTLSHLREEISKNGIMELMKPNLKYSFLFKKAPVSLVQENKRMIQDCVNLEAENPTIIIRKEFAKFT